MNHLTDKLRLKELAEEDIYFAKRDRELIKALHDRKLAKRLNIETKKQKKKAETLEQRYADETARHRHKPRKLGKIYRNLIKKVLKLISKKAR